MVVEWLDKNWDKILMMVFTAVGVVYAALRRFITRIATTERDVVELRDKIKTMQAELDRGVIEKAELESEVMAMLDRLQDKLDVIIDMRVVMEKHGTLINSIKEDVTELRDDVKRLMRG